MGKDEPKLSLEERETVMSMDMKTRRWTITTVIPKHVRRLTKLHGKGEVLDQFGTTRWTLPEAAVWLRAVKPASDAQREGGRKLQKARRGLGSNDLKAATPPETLPPPF